jgi:hypothetical protein
VSTSYKRKLREVDDRILQNGKVLKEIIEVVVGDGMWENERHDDDGITEEHGDARGGDVGT